MRTTKRFTPQVLARFQNKERGTGTHAHYVPWHQVTRGDPASGGRSHLVAWRGRLRHFLSDGELDQQLFATMLPDLFDALEQYPLSVNGERHPLTAYTNPAEPTDDLPGTLEIAAQLGIKHPLCRGHGQTSKWTLSTDLLLVLKDGAGTHTMLALAFKPRNWAEKRRTTELLTIEREYWRARGVEWLLICPTLYDPATSLFLRRTACWALVDPVETTLLDQARQTAINNPSDSVTSLLNMISSSATVDISTAQRALWQAVWQGRLPIDMRRSWRPHYPLRLLSHKEFWSLNPIAARRSAWT